MKKIVSLGIMLAIVMCILPIMSKNAKAGQYDYTLTFDANGGHIGSANGPGTKTVTLPPSSYAAGLECSEAKNTAYRTGYTFLGWFDANGKQYKSGVTGSPATVYAHWQKSSTYYAVTFSTNGVSGISNMPQGGKVRSGVSYTIPSSPKPTRSGYTFVGYYEASNSSTIYQPGQLLTSSIQRSYTLIPKWTITYYTITFNKGNVTGITSWPQNTTVTLGAKYTIPTAARTYYRLSYYTDANGKLYYPGDVITVSKNLKLTPFWMSDQFVVCNDNPGPGNYAHNTYTKTKYKGELFIGSDGFVIGGWALHDRGIKSYSYVIKDANGTKVQSGNLAMWNRSKDTDLANLLFSLQCEGKIGSGVLSEAGYRGTISVSGLKQAGKYYAYVIGLLKDGTSFTIARIEFNITNKYLARYFQYQHSNTPKQTTTFYWQQVLEAEDLDEIFNTTPVEYGKHRVWYYRLDATGDKTKKVTFPMKITEPVDVYYVDENNKCNVMFCDRNGVMIGEKAVTMKSTERFCDVIEPPVVSGMIFVGWGTGRDDIAQKKPIYQPEHICFFDNNEKNAIYYALYIPNASNKYEIRYRFNYEDLHQTINLFDTCLLGPAKEAAGIESFKNSAVEIVGTFFDAALTYLKVCQKAVNKLKLKTPKAAMILFAVGVIEKEVKKRTESSAKKEIYNRTLEDSEKLKVTYNTKKQTSVFPHLLNHPSYECTTDVWVWPKGDSMVIDLRGESLQ